jgi:hypothetical protein
LAIDELQADLDIWLVEYNEQRPHQGRWCFGKTPMQTFLDALPMAREKLMARRQRREDRQGMDVALIEHAQDDVDDDDRRGDEIGLAGQRRLECLGVALEIADQGRRRAELRLGILGARLKDRVTDGYSALCSRWLTMRRMAEDAPVRTLGLASRYSYPRIFAAAAISRRVLSSVPTVMRRYGAVRGLLKCRTSTACSRSAAANSAPPRAGCLAKTKLALEGRTAKSDFANANPASPISGNDRHGRPSGPAMTPIG